VQDAAHAPKERLEIRRAQLYIAAKRPIGRLVPAVHPFARDDPPAQDGRGIVQHDEVGIAADTTPGTGIVLKTRRVRVSASWSGVKATQALNTLILDYLGP
jgi:hypothetical protein